MAADGIYQVSFNGVWAPRGDRFSNIFHYRVVGTSGGASPYQVAAAILDAMVDADCIATFLAIIATDVELRTAVCRKINPGGGVPAFKLITTAGDQVIESDTIATGAQIRWYGTPFEKDGGPFVPQGWTTLPGISSDNYTAGGWTAPYVVEINAFIVAMTTTLDLGMEADGTADLVLLLKDQPAGNTITGGDVKGRPGVLVRRLDRGID